ncbi:3-isopropylmalate dehydratase large subunit [Nocardia sp. NPDC001965]
MTMFEKIWRHHSLVEDVDGQTLLAIDRHLVHEGSARAFQILNARGLTVRRPDLTIGMADHIVPTEPGARRLTDFQRGALDLFDGNLQKSRVRTFGFGHPQQGIVHVVGPEQGLTLPGMTVVCGDSHASTHGALGAIGLGIGASEVAHVLATQTLWQKRPKTMRLLVDNMLAPGVTAKDLILAVIGRIGAAGAAGHVIEYAGAAIRALSMEGRLTICNMSIEAGARAGLIAPDDITLEYVHNRTYAPKGAVWQQASEDWLALPSDPGATFDREVQVDATTISPMVTWGTSPEDTAAIDGRVPDPAGFSGVRKEAMVKALDYIGLQPGTPIEGIPVDRVFIGSCTNGRIEDLRAAAHVARGRYVASGVTAVVVPGSTAVKRAAEHEGLDRVFRDAGFQWHESGCSMCVGLNGDIGSPGERVASSSNRNFVGRQGPGVRTHLMSPAMAAAAGVTGCFTDVRRLIEV